MQEYLLVATMGSAKEASAFTRELASFFATHARQHDKAAERDDFEWPGAPTPAALALAAKHGTKWRDALVWGEEQLVGDEPSVAAFDNKVVVFHGFCSGGLSADLARVMAKRSGKRVVVESAVPVVYCEATLDPRGKLARELTTMFAQRETIEHLADWKQPSWRLRGSPARLARRWCEPQAAATRAPQDRSQPGAVLRARGRRVRHRLVRAPLQARLNRARGPSRSPRASRSSRRLLVIRRPLKPFA